jgi:hypothetical protein
MYRMALSIVLIVLLEFFYFTSPSVGQFYKWTDKEGTVHYSDDPTDVPDSSKEQKDSANAESKELPLKKGWNEERLDQAISGCTYGMMDSSMKSYKQRALDDGHQVTAEEMEQVQSRLYPIFNKTCRCVFEKASQKFSFEKISKKSPETQEYIKSLLEDNVCPLPVPPR